MFSSRRFFFQHIRLYSSGKPLVKFENANVYRFGSKEPAFKNLTLTLNSHDRLVIVGPVSAGKTTLAEVFITYVRTRELLVIIM